MGFDRGVSIREERKADREAVWKVNQTAFEGQTEARLVEQLRSNDRVLLSLVAEFWDSRAADPRVVGHILFSEALVFLKGGFSRPVVALAPMAVLPRFQRQGIGSRLVRGGLDRLRELGHQAVFVLGHAAYYPRFGFGPASRFRVECPYKVPDEAFMALELRPDALKGAEGPLHYAPEFGEV